MKKRMIGMQLGDVNDGGGGIGGISLRVLAASDANLFFSTH